MTRCIDSRHLIEKVLDGTISAPEREELKAHAETCEACRAELRQYHLLEEVVRDALASPTAAEQASKRIMTKLAAEPRPQAGAVRLTWTRVSAAAGVILGIGLALGFVAGQMHLGGPPPAPPLTQVPMHIGHLEGTVLVRHDNSDVWQSVQSGAVVYLGDTFHSMPKAEFILELPNNSTIAVNQNSMLALTSYNGETQFSLEQGECTASLESPHGPFFINTPHGQVEALGTEFTVTVE